MIEPRADLIRYETAEQLANVYTESTAKIRAAILTIGEECRRLKDTFGEESRYHFSLSISQSSRTHDCDEKGVEEVIHKMKLEAWAVIIEKLNIYRLMSSKRVAELREALGGGKGVSEFPEILPETIRAVCEGYAMSATEFLEEAVKEEYDFWRPSKRYAPYKRNSEWKLNAKIIHPYMVEVGYDRAFRAAYRSQSHITALDSIFHMLDGQGPVREYKGALVTAIETSNGQGETTYFRFKCFKNGNLHLEFKRQDLLDLFNQIAGKAVLGFERQTA